MDGTLDGTTKAAVGANGLAVDVKAAIITSGTITTVSAVTAISNALPAGTNAIGKLAANSGVDIGDVDVTSVTLPTGAGTVGDGRKTCTLAGTADQFSSQACKHVILTALEANTDIVVIGSSTVVASSSTRRGHPLTPNQNVRLEISNLNLLYIDAVVSGEGVSFAYFS